MIKKIKELDTEFFLNKGYQIASVLYESTDSELKFIFLGSKLVFLITLKCGYKFDFI